jgi:SAM-dependent methyltransferase
LYVRKIRRELRLLAMEAAMMAQRDVWASGDRYEPYVGRWSRLVARDFVDWLGVPPGKRWLDVGCGTGALAQTVLDRAAPAGVFGIDPSEGFLANARRYIADKRARFEIADAQALPVADRAFDVAVSGLVLNFVPDPAKAAREMRRAVASGGTVAAYVWDYAGEMQMMRRFWDAAVALDPAAREKDEGVRFPLCQPEPFAALLRDAGLTEVEARAIDVPTVFKDFDDFWTPFLSGQAPAPGYCISLSEDRRAALRERLRATLPTRPDGSIHLIARAWAARGEVK